MLFLAAVLALPAESPIACQVCSNTATLTFAGTVSLAQSGRLHVFNGKTHQTMGFSVPAGFAGVQSSDGVVKNATLARVRPGLLARVTYRTIAGERVPTEVLLLTINQCRSLQAAEKLSRAPVDCPD
jgi:hypothetical protein